MVYYELPMGSGIWLDWVTIEISDGRNWYTVFNWGNNIADGNTNMDFNNLPYPVMGPVPLQMSRISVIFRWPTSIHFRARKSPSTWTVWSPLGRMITSGFPAQAALTVYQIRMAKWRLTRLQ